MIRHILKKDWTLLWPLALLVCAIQIAYEWAAYKLDLVSGSAVASQLLRPLQIAWHVGIVCLAMFVVQEDAIPGVDQDWLIRPLPRTELLLSKLSFVAITVCVPMFVLNVWHAVMLGFPLGSTVGFALYKLAFVFLCLLVPAMALAATVRNMSELLVLLAVVVVLYAACLGLAAGMLGADRCPTCDTSVSWQQHVLQHIEVLLGSLLILGLQYYRRRTDLSRRVAVAGAVVLAFAQLPWSLAFAIQQHVTGDPDGPRQIQVELGVQSPSAAGNHAGKGATNVARETTQALLSGNVAGAVKSLRQFNRGDDTRVVLHVPVQIAGLSGDQFLRADRADFTLVDPGGQVLYRGRNGWPGAVSFLPDPATGTLRQDLEIPARAYERLRGKPVRVRIEYSLTLMTASSQYRLRAYDGEVAAPDVGTCQSVGAESVVSLRCRKTGNPPVCFSATIYGPEGAHDAPVAHCSEDYRPYIPALTNIITVSGVDMATRDPYGIAHYEVDPAELPQSYLLLKIYRATSHFRRTAVSATFNVADR